ncbi:DUF4064 domain-containing protein [Candidatus Pacearchaeota archaeon]|nr:DUF4064 domain-containing protein [Candidatus Pacearchaeota archaeon]
MSEGSRAGFVFALIGSIIGLLISLILLIFAWITKSIGPGPKLYEAMTSSYKTNLIFLSIFGAWYLITSILVIIAAFWMRSAEKCRKGGIIALIFGLFGGGTIVGAIGGILGIIESGNK